MQSENKLEALATTHPTLADDHAVQRAERAGKCAKNGQRGMTLLEIMIVLAILALVMGLLVGPRVFSMFAESKVGVCKTEVKQLAYEAYLRWDTNTPSKSGPCPPSLADLTKYTNKKDGKDPWGADYAMHCGSSAPPEEIFGVSSPGPDGKPGTPDDIKSWEQK